jgi:hypothetical protein
MFRFPTLGVQMRGPAHLLELLHMYHRRSSTLPQQLLGKLITSSINTDSLGKPGFLGIIPILSQAVKELHH